MLIEYSQKHTRQWCVPKTVHIMKMISDGQKSQLWEEKNEKIDTESDIHSVTGTLYQTQKF